MDGHVSAAEGGDGFSIPRALYATAPALAQFVIEAKAVCRQVVYLNSVPN
ncbi:MAG: hypothetical protein IH957_06265 [Chloroflexi bacterium]|nr:hypothetical protein [Chloroflexota bacterium]